jgi:kinesin family member 11
MYILLYTRLCFTFLIEWYLQMDGSQKKGGSALMSPSPKSSDRSNRDFRSNDSNGSSNSSKYDKEKGVNVQVIVRCR